MSADAYLAADPRPFDIDSGRLVTPGARIDASDLNLDGPHDSALLEAGKLVPYNPTPPPWELTGDALTDAARTAGIDGFSTMKADELRTALYDHYHPDEEA